MSCAEVISLDQVRARTHWTTLRQQLHERFDRWLDRLEAALPEGEPTLGQVSETIWASPFNIVIAGRDARTSTHDCYSRIRCLEAVLLCDRIEIRRGNVSTHVESPGLYALGETLGN